MLNFDLNDQNVTEASSRAQVLAPDHKSSPLARRQDPWSYACLGTQTENIYKHTKDEKYVTDRIIFIYILHPPRDPCHLMG